MNRADLDWLLEEITDLIERFEIQRLETEDGKIIYKVVFL